MQAISIKLKTLQSQRINLGFLYITFNSSRATDRNTMFQLRGALEISKKTIKIAASNQNRISTSLSLVFDHSLAN